MNCKSLMRNYLMERNPLNKVKWPLAILFSIFAISVYINKNKSRSFDKFNLLIIAIVVSTITVIISNIIINSSISQVELSSLVNRCQNCMADPNVPHIENITANDVINYTGRVSSATKRLLNRTQMRENFESNTNTNTNTNASSESTTDALAQAGLLDLDSLNKLSTDSNEEEEEEMPIKTVSKTITSVVKDNENESEMKPVENFMSATPTRSMPSPFTPTKQSNQQSNQQLNNKCLLGCDKCAPLCSGYTTNPCNIVSPVPGPTWQVQTAETVQNRISNNQFVPSTCPQ